MKYPQDAPRVAALNQFIEAVHGGQLDGMVQQLQKVIYMFHYLDPDLVPEVERQDAVFLLHGMADALTTEDLS